ncbi:MAG: biotin transporter BioY [Synechococcales bacterium]|nr:biotin transporter BioY [Synechococcales bacterium]
MTYVTYADLWKPAEQSRTWLYNLALILGGSLIIGLCAQVSIPLPFSPVPITAQTFAVLLAGILLGHRRGMLCVATYLAEGLAGLPVFSNGGAGIAHLLGPTGGYLVGYLGAATLVGWLAEQGWDRKFSTTFLAMLLGNVVLYISGLAWLAVFTGVEQALPLGLYPFIPGDLFKIAIATATVPLGWKFLVPSDRR